VLLGVVSSPAVAATGSWSTPVDLSAAGVIAQNPQISVDSTGTAIAVWNGWNAGTDVVQSASSTDGGVTWTTPEDIYSGGGTAFNPQISVDAAGTAYAVWYRWNGSNDIVQSAWSGDGGVSWSIPEDLSAADGYAEDPQVVVTAAGNAVAIWRRDDDINNNVQSAWSSDGGVTWSTPVDLSAPGSDGANPQISVDAKGNVFAIWRRYDGNDNIVQVSSLTLPTLADTGATSGAVTTTVGVGAGLLTAGALALVLLRRRLARS
jgi:hypothetical protein